MLGAALQRRGGDARHDAVAWGYARGADALGVDIIQNCEVTGDPARAGRRGRERSRPRAASSRTRQVGVVAAGHTSVIMAHGRPRMPLESFPLQALVSEPVKPVFPCVVMSNAMHAYISPIRQGRAGHRRRHRRLYLLQPARRPAHRRRIRSRRSASCFRCVPAPAHAAQLGRHRRRDAGSLADHRQDTGRRPLCQLRLGHRRLQGDAGLGPRLRGTPSRGRARTRSTRHSRWSDSARAF